MFQQLRNAGLKLGPKKYTFGKSECIFLGHQISSTGIRPPPDRVKTIQDYPLPTSAKELQRFIGLLNWFRKFYQISLPFLKKLHEFLRNGDSFIWTTKHTECINELKHRLLNSEVLAFPRFDVPFILAVDTSSHGIAYLLYQILPKQDFRAREIQNSCDSLWIIRTVSLAEVIWPYQIKGC